MHKDNLMGVQFKLLAVFSLRFYHDMAFSYVPVQDFHGFAHSYLDSAFWMSCFYLMLVFGRSYICFKMFEDSWR
eukprot:maker-scaffold_12-snap-gene-7.48-mRNA-1 protein AED:0.18 eAED:0.32 QI:1086/0/0.5/1/0/0/2/0/73